MDWFLLHIFADSFLISVPSILLTSDNTCTCFNSSHFRFLPHLLYFTISLFFISFSCFHPLDLSSLLIFTFILGHSHEPLWRWWELVPPTVIIRKCGQRDPHPASKPLQNSYKKLFILFRRRKPPALFRILSSGTEKRGWSPWASTNASLAWWQISFPLTSVRGHHSRPFSATENLWKVVKCRLNLIILHCWHRLATNALSPKTGKHQSPAGHIYMHRIRH